MEKLIQEEKHQIQDFANKLEATPLKKFLNSTRDIGLNLCLMKTCGNNPPGYKCNNENDLTEKIMDCLSSKGFLGQYGLNRTEQDKQYCQMRCEIRFGIEPTSSKFFLNSQSQQTNLIELFMNPYNEYDSYHSQVNTCILRNKKIWKFFKDIKKEKTKFVDKDFDELCRQTQDDCFKQHFDEKFTKVEQQILSCAYYCNFFDPEVKNKIRMYGQQIQDGKHGDYDKNIRFRDLRK